MTEDRLLEVLEEALSARVIEELPRSVGRYQFTHALIQETLAGELSTTRKVRLHARIAETLEEFYGPGAASHAAELAIHFVEAQTVLGTEKLIHYSFLAGDQALGARAYEEAEAHFQRGLEAKGVALTGTEPAEDEEAAAFLSCLGQAQIGTLSEFGGFAAFTSLSRAFDYYEGVGDVAAAVGITAYKMHINYGLGPVEKALELVPPDSHDAGRLLARSITALRPEYERAQEAATGALFIARRHQDPELEMYTLVAAACIDISYCGFGLCVDRNSQAIRLARHLEQPFDEAHALFDISRALSALGDLDEAARHAEKMLGWQWRTGRVIAIGGPSPGRPTRVCAGIREIGRRPESSPIKVWR